MTRNRSRCWTCIVVGAVALGLNALAAAEAPPASGDETQGEPLVCKSTCTYRCQCRRGIYATSYKNLLLFNFGSTLSGRIELEYERALHPRVSIFVGAYAVAYDSLGNAQLVGFGALGGARVYLVGSAPEGIWFAWEIGGFRRNERGNPDVLLRGVQTGGMIGWTGVWSRFALTLGAGGTYTHGRVQVFEQSVIDVEWNPWLKIGVGVAF